MRNFQRLSALFAVLLISLLSACATKTPAPVADRRPPSAAETTSLSASPASSATKPASATDAKPADLGKTHTVQKGDTLIGLALQYGLDYRELAAWNNIENPNVIKVDDVLRLTAPGSNGTPSASKEPKPGAPVVTPLAPAALPSAANERPASNTATSKAEPKGGKIPYTDQAYQRLSAQAVVPIAPTVSPPAVTPTSPTQTPAPTPPVTAGDDVEWAWPVKGKVIAAFTEANKGIDIAGAKGTAVNAAGAGKVIYSGSGLRGYGRLVIIKHNVTWFSAYAHNEKILVAEGQEVKRGQKIAEMGSSDADQVKLHFEIRKNGKPLDPMKFLPGQ